MRFCFILGLLLVVFSGCDAGHQWSIDGTHSGEGHNGRWSAGYLGFDGYVNIDGRKFAFRNHGDYFALMFAPNGPKPVYPLMFVAVSDVFPAFEPTTVYSLDELADYQLSGVWFDSFGNFTSIPHDSEYWLDEHPGAAQFFYAHYVPLPDVDEDTIYTPATLEMLIGIHGEPDYFQVTGGTPYHVWALPGIEGMTETVVHLCYREMGKNYTFQNGTGFVGTEYSGPRWMPARWSVGGRLTNVPESVERMSEKDWEWLEEHPLALSID